VQYSSNQNYHNINLSTTVVIERLKIAYTVKTGNYCAMKPYSNDLRRRIIDRLQANEESQPEIAEHFAVSLSFVEKLWSRFRSTGKFAALPHAGGRARALKMEESLIRREIAAQPDTTLVELAEKVALESGKARVSATTMSQELRRLNLPRKKR
jgi:transposase